MIQGDSNGDLSGQPRVFPQQNSAFGPFSLNHWFIMGGGNTFKSLVKLKCYSKIKDPTQLYRVLMNEEYKTLYVDANAIFHVKMLKIFNRDQVSIRTKLLEFLEMVKVKLQSWSLLRQSEIKVVVVLDGPLKKSCPSTQERRSQRLPQVQNPKHFVCLTS